MVSTLHMRSDANASLRHYKVMGKDKNITKRVKWESAYATTGNSTPQDLVYKNETILEIAIRSHAHGMRCIYNAFIILMIISNGIGAAPAQRYEHSSPYTSTAVRLLEQSARVNCQQTQGDKKSINLLHFRIYFLLAATRISSLS